jgi:predicted CoA-binding protein
MTKDAKVIHSPQLANYLLQQGYTIIKLKPKRGNEYETVYVFRLDQGLLDAVAEWMEHAEYNK